MATSRHSQLHRKLANLVTVLTALAGLTLPGLLLHGGTWTSTVENRRAAPAPPPPGAIADFPRFTGEFESWFEDHLGARTQLITLKAWFDYKVLRSSSTPKVQLGREGWLYYAGDESFEDFTGQLTPSQDDIDHWYRALRQRQTALTQRGIPYFMVWAPNKQSIHPEFVRAGVHRAAQTGLDLLLAGLRARAAADHVELPIVDLRTRLNAEKGRHLDGAPLYHPTDVHWNGFGAYLAFDELAHAIAAAHPQIIRPLALSREDFRAAPISSGDLASMMFLPRYPRTLTTVSRVTSLPSCQVSPLPGAPDDGRRVDSCKAGAGKALVFHDSMVYAMRDYLSHSFGAVRYRKLYPAEDQILEEVDRERPDVVIEMRVERMFHSLPELLITEKLERVATAEQMKTAMQREGGIYIETPPDQKRLELDGWAQWSPRDPAARLKLYTDLPISRFRLALKPRRDVGKSLHDRRLRNAGFLLSLTLDQPLDSTKQTPRFCLYSEDPTYGTHALRFSSYENWDACPTAP